MKENGIFNRINALRIAAWGVAKGPTGNSPEQRHVKAYINLYQSKVDFSSKDIYNPNEETIHKIFIDRVKNSINDQRFNPHEWANFTWGRPQLYMDRIAGAVISFSDDHYNRITKEFFPVNYMITFLQEVIEKYQHTGRKVTIPEQFGIGMQLAEDNPVAAAILAHAAYRSVGRVLDTRVSELLKFPVDAPNGNISMLKLAECTAHFNSDRINSDPLGDTYHWWGQYAANLVFELNKSAKPIQSRIYQKGFYYGPNLMTFAREILFNNKQIAGNHKDVDRQGIHTGIVVGRFIRKTIDNVS